MSILTINWRIRTKRGLTQVVDDGEKRWGKVLPISVIENILTKGNLNERPDTNEDWKFFVWLYDGPKPSQVDTVEVKFSTCGKHAVLLWRMKNGLQQIEGSS